MKWLAVVFGGFAFLAFTLGLIFFALWGILPTLLKPLFNAATGGALSFASSLNITGAGVTSNGKAFATAYCPKNSKQEGGLNDQKGNPLQTLQDYVAGKAPYVSVAMDNALHQQYPYGTVIHIPELDKKFNNGKPIEFRFVDSGGSFTGTARHPMDGQKKPRGKTAVDVANSCSYMNSGWNNLEVTLVFPK